MSFTKRQVEKLFQYAAEIKDETLENVDSSSELEAFNLVLNIAEEFRKKHTDLGYYFDEIQSDMLSILQSGLTGNYRLAIGGLRGVLELICHVFYYCDHPLERKIFIDNDECATRYVSSLVQNESFFKTKYIKAFNANSKFEEVKTDAFAHLLVNEYKNLCDHVHGRTRSLTKIESQHISFDIKLYAALSKYYQNIVSILAMMFEFKFPGNEDVTKRVGSSPYLHSIIKRGR